MFLCIVKYDCLIYHHQLMEMRHKKIQKLAKKLHDILCRQLLERQTVVRKHWRSKFLLNTGP